MWRRVFEGPIKRVGRYALAGLFGGLIVFLIESVDRLLTLWPSFNSAYEPILFAAYLAPIVLIGVLAGTGLGIGLVATEGLFVSVRHFAGRSPRHIATWPAGIITVVVLALLLRALLVLVPITLKHTVADFAWRLQNQFFPTLDPYGNYTRVLVFAGLVIGVALLLFAGRLLNLVLSSQSRLPRVILCALLALVLVGLYVVDSRFEFGRHEAAVHLPLDVLQFVTAVFLAVFAGGAIGAGFLKPRSTKWVVGLLITGVLGACAFDAVHVGTNKNLKALLWRRSIVARRAYQIVAAFANSSGDGLPSVSYAGKRADNNLDIVAAAGDMRAYRIDRERFSGDPVALQGRSILPVSFQVGLTKPANFILITVDTLRADRMSCYGYNRPTAPRLSGLAGAGRLFERAYSQATSTGPAFASMQRSAMRGSVFDATRPTLFGLLAEAGYRTALVSAGPDDVWLRKNNAWKQYREIMFSGIQEIPHNSGALWDAQGVTDKAIEYFASIPTGTKRATWIHYLDPHAPRHKLPAFDFGDTDSDRYDSEVAFVDREVGRLLDFLRTSGAMLNSIVVFTADHGESFSEHGMSEHGNRPYDEQVHIPLVIWAPALAPSRVTEPAALIDIAPTVLGFLGIRGIPEAEGRDLLIDHLDSRPIFSEVDANYCDPSFFSYSSFFPYAVTDGEWRLIYDVRGNTEELYNLTRDPGEIHSLADKEPARLNRMREILVHWLRNSTAVHRPS